MSESNEPGTNKRPASLPPAPSTAAPSLRRSVRIQELPTKPVYTKTPARNPSRSKSPSKKRTHPPVNNANHILKFVPFLDIFRTSELHPQLLTMIEHYVNLGIIPADYFLKNEGAALVVEMTKVSYPLTASARTLKLVAEARRRLRCSALFSTETVPSVDPLLPITPVPMDNEDSATVTTATTTTLSSSSSFSSSTVSSPDPKLRQRLRDLHVTQNPVAYLHAFVTDWYGERYLHWDYVCAEAAKGNSKPYAASPLDWEGPFPRPHDILSDAAVYNAHTVEYLPFEPLQCSCLPCLRERYHLVEEERLHSNLRAYRNALNEALAVEGKKASIPSGKLPFRTVPPLYQYMYPERLQSLHEQKQRLALESARLRSAGALLQIFHTEDAHIIAGDVAHARFRTTTAHQPLLFMNPLVDPVPKNFVRIANTLIRLPTYQWVNVPYNGRTSILADDIVRPAWSDVTAWMGLPGPVASVFGATVTQANQYLDELRTAEVYAGATYWSNHGLALHTVNPSDSHYRTYVPETNNCGGTDGNVSSPSPLTSWKFLPRTDSSQDWVSPTPIAPVPLTLPLEITGAYSILDLVVNKLRNGNGAPGTVPVSVQNFRPSTALVHSLTTQFRTIVNDVNTNVKHRLYFGWFPQPYTLAQRTLVERKRKAAATMTTTLSSSSAVVARPSNANRSSTRTVTPTFAAKAALPPLPTDDDPLPQEFLDILRTYNIHNPSGPAVRSTALATIRSVHRTVALLQILGLLPKDGYGLVTHLDSNPGDIRKIAGNDDDKNLPVVTDIFANPFAPDRVTSNSVAPYYFEALHRTDANVYVRKQCLLTNQYEPVPLTSPVSPSFKWLPFDNGQAFAASTDSRLYDPAYTVRLPLPREERKKGTMGPLSRVLALSYGIPFLPSLVHPALPVNQTGPSSFLATTFASVIQALPPPVASLARMVRPKVTEQIRTTWSYTDKYIANEAQINETLLTDETYENRAMVPIPFLSPRCYDKVVNHYRATNPTNVTRIGSNNGNVTVPTIPSPVDGKTSNVSFAPSSSLSSSASSSSLTASSTVNPFSAPLPHTLSFSSVIRRILAAEYDFRSIVDDSLTGKSYLPLTIDNEANRYPAGYQPYFCNYYPLAAVTGMHERQCTTDVLTAVLTKAYAPVPVPDTVLPSPNLDLSILRSFTGIVPTAQRIARIATYARRAIEHTWHTMANAYFLQNLNVLDERTEAAVNRFAGTDAVARVRGSATSSSAMNVLSSSTVPLTELSSTDPPIVVSSTPNPRDTAAVPAPIRKRTEPNLDRCIVGCYYPVSRRNRNKFPLKDIPVELGFRVNINSATFIPNYPPLHLLAWIKNQGNVPFSPLSRLSSSVPVPLPSLTGSTVPLHANAANVSPPTVSPLIHTQGLFPAPVAYEPACGSGIYQGWIHPSKDNPLMYKGMLDYMGTRLPNTAAELTYHENDHQEMFDISRRISGAVYEEAYNQVHEITPIDPDERNDDGTVPVTKPKRRSRTPNKDWDAQTLRYAKQYEILLDWKNRKLASPSVPNVPATKSTRKASKTPTNDSTTGVAFAGVPKPLYPPLPVQSDETLTIPFEIPPPVPNDLVGIQALQAYDTHIHPLGTTGPNGIHDPVPRAEKLAAKQERTREKLSKYIKYNLGFDPESFVRRPANFPTVPSTEKIVPPPRPVDTAFVTAFDARFGKVDHSRPEAVLVPTAHPDKEGKEGVAKPNGDTGTDENDNDNDVQYVYEEAYRVPLMSRQLLARSLRASAYWRLVTCSLGLTERQPLTSRITNLSRIAALLTITPEQGYSTEGTEIRKRILPWETIMRYALYQYPVVPLNDRATPSSVRSILTTDFTQRGKGNAGPVNPSSAFIAIPSAVPNSNVTIPLSPPPVPSTSAGIPPVTSGAVSSRSPPSASSLSSVPPRDPTTTALVRATVTKIFTNVRREKDSGTLGTSDDVCKRILFDALESGLTMEDSVRTAICAYNEVRETILSPLPGSTVPRSTSTAPPEKPSSKWKDYGYGHYPHHRLHECPMWYSDDDEDENEGEANEDVENGTVDIGTNNNGTLRSSSRAQSDPPSLQQRTVPTATAVSPFFTEHEKEDDPDSTTVLPSRPADRRRQTTTCAMVGDDGKALIPSNHPELTASGRPRRKATIGISYTEYVNYGDGNNGEDSDSSEEKGKESDDDFEYRSVHSEPDAAVEGDEPRTVANVRGRSSQRIVIVPVPLSSQGTEKALTELLPQTLGKMGTVAAATKRGRSATKKPGATVRAKSTETNNRTKTVHGTTTTTTPNGTGRSRSNGQRAASVPLALTENDNTVNGTSTTIRIIPPRTPAEITAAQTLFIHTWTAKGQYCKSPSCPDYDVPFHGTPIQQKTNMGIHQKEVHADHLAANEGVVCETCGQVFGGDWSRKICKDHVLYAHDPDKWTPCPFGCGDLIDYPRHLQEHMNKCDRNPHPPPPQETLYCTEDPTNCRFGATHAGNLHKHIYNVHGNVKYPCLHCDKTFTHSSRLGRHLTLHHSFVNKKDALAYAKAKADEQKAAYDATKTAKGLRGKN